MNILEKYLRKIQSSSESIFPMDSAHTGKKFDPSPHYVSAVEEEHNSKEEDPNRYDMKISDIFKKVDVFPELLKDIKRKMNTTDDENGELTEEEPDNVKSEDDLNAQIDNVPLDI